MDVFISYNRTDRMLAAKMCYALEKVGIQTWFAEKKLFAGVDFPTVIKASITECKCVIAIVSDYSGGSGHVMNEVANARNHGIPVIPYRTDTKTTDLSDYLSKYTWIDAAADPYEKLAEAVEAVLLNLNEEPREPVHELSSFSRIKPLKRTIGKFVFFAFMAELITISWYLSLNFSRYFFIPFGMAVLISIILPMMQIKRCAFLKCKRLRYGSKTKVINTRTRRVKYLDLCGEHKYTLSMTLYDKKSYVSVWSAIFVFLFAGLMAVAFFMFSLKFRDLIVIKPIFHPTWQSSQNLAQSISMTDGNVLAIKRDGTLYAYDASNYGDDLLDISGVDSVSAAPDHMAAVRYDGTVVCVGDNSFRQCEVSVFEGINAVDVECGNGFTVMLSCAGNIYGTGRNDMGQLDFGSLSGVAQISAGKDHVLALLKDGTVRAYGDNSFMQCEVEKWKDIVQISAGENISAALTGSGMVLTTAGSTDSWSGVVQIAAGKSMVAALTKSGTVKVLGTEALRVPDVDGWRRIAAVAVYGDRVVGIKSDGTVLEAAPNGKNYTTDSIKLGAPELSREEAYYYARRISAGDGYAFYIENSDVRATEDAPKTDIVGFEDTTQIRINKAIVAGINSQQAIEGLFRKGADTDIAFDGWDGVVYFDLAEEYAVCVTKTGDVTYSGADEYGQSAIEDIDGVRLVSAAKNHVAAVREDGSLVCAGENDYGECDTEGFSDIVWLDTGNYHTAAVREDGSVLACGRNISGQCDVDEWSDVVTVTVGDAFTVGIKNDGQLISVGDIDLSTYTGDSAVAVDAYGAYCFIWEEDGTVYRTQAR